MEDHLLNEQRTSTRVNDELTPVRPQRRRVDDDHQSNDNLIRSYSTKEKN